MFTLPMFVFDSPHHDENLNGPFLSLEGNAYNSCNKDANGSLNSDLTGKIHGAITDDEWKWDGPQVVRTVPPDDVLRQIKPGSKGIIHYEDSVVLLQHDSSGRVVKTSSPKGKW